MELIDWQHRLHIQVKLPALSFMSVLTSAHDYLKQVSAWEKVKMNHKGNSVKDIWLGNQ